MVPHQSPAPRVTNLPAPVSTFIGRLRETAEITRLLSERRLLTLAGPGGSGKTRLALHVASGIQPRYSDGVWLVGLAPVQDGDLIPQAIADTFGVRERAGQLLENSLVDFMRPKSVLLVLDNCEHLIEPAARLTATILENCPAVSVLTTSREPLGVAGEAVFLVPPLSLPEPQPWRDPSSEQLALAAYQQSEAVQLFLDRAVAILPRYQMTPPNAPWIARICRRLDGMPLAIELAASRLPTLSAREIAERLDDRFALLTSRQNTAIPRHKSLEAMLDWSHDLLTEPEETLFRRLSVFNGGWTLKAAVAVCAFGDVAPEDVIELLGGLVARSMVVANQNTDSDRRFHYLETIHEYAAGKLAASEEQSALRERHLDYFLDWAERNSPVILSNDLTDALEQFKAEHDNVQAALEWSLHAEKGSTAGLRLATACGTFWNTTGHLNLGRAYLSRALVRPEAQERNLERAEALLVAGSLAWSQSDFAAAREFTEEALSISTELGEPAKGTLASAYSDLGDLFTDLGDHALSQYYLGRALALYRELGNLCQAAYVLSLLGWAAIRRGQFDEAKRALSESLALQREACGAQLMGLTLAGLGQLALRQGHHDEALIHLNKSLELREGAGYQWGTASTLGLLGWLMLIMRDFDRMRELLRRSITIRVALEQQGGLAWCLEKLAEASVIQARDVPARQRTAIHRQAAQVFAAASTLRAPVNSVIDPADQANYQQLLDELRGSLGDTAFEMAWTEGQSAQVSDMIDLALTPIAQAVAGTGQVHFGGLSPREQETAALVAQGKSNREIAETMVVSEKTIETYVTRILNKLGYNSRVQIATWAYDRGLIRPDSGQHPPTTPTQ